MEVSSSNSRLFLRTLLIRKQTIFVCFSTIILSLSVLTVFLSYCRLSKQTYQTILPKIEIRVGFLGANRSELSQPALFQLLHSICFLFFCGHLSDIYKNCALRAKEDNATWQFLFHPYLPQSRKELGLLTLGDEAVSLGVSSYHKGEIQL